MGTSTTNQYSSSSSTDATTISGQVTLTKNEELSNTGFESDLTGWNTGAQPDSISGLQLWLKADAGVYNDVGSTPASDGNTVQQWNDQSGNSRNATQATSGLRPVYKTGILNSLPVIRFDGTDDRIVSPFSFTLTSYSAFAVVQTKGTNDKGILDIRNSTNPVPVVQMNHSSNTFQSRNRNDANTTVTIDSGINTNNTTGIMGQKWDGTTLFSYINGVAGTSGAASGNITIDLARVGSSDAGFTWDSDIAEMIIYNSSLSTADRTRIENYLRDKYAITVSSGITSATRDTATTYSSSAGSAKLVTSSSDTGEFTQSVNVGDTNVYNLSAYARTDGSAVTSSDVELFYNGSTVSTTYTSVGSGWYQLTGTVTGANASRAYGVQVKAGKTVYIDNASLNNYTSGTLTSSIFDTEQGSNWGTLTYTATTPTNTSVSVKARTSNSSSMSGATAFSSCTAITSGSDISANGCVTDTHRYIQYELTLANTTSDVTPTFQDISIAFTVSDVTAPSTSLTAQSPDPNSDNTPTLSGTATEDTGTVSAVQFQVDSTSGSWTACTASDGSFNSASEAFSCTAATLTDGSHTMYVRATDSNGNTTSSGYASDTFTIDATTPVSLELDSPGDNNYTNSERPSFKWRSTTDTTAGLSKYVLEIDNPSVGSSQPSGDFSIDNIPTFRTTDYETTKYVIHYDGFSDSDSTNNYISVSTKSSSDWGSSENDGKLREGRVSWKVKAVDNAGNETSSSRTLFVDRTNPNVELTQINSTPFTSSNFSTTDKTPTIFGKITDQLAGGDSTQTQDENGPRVASGPKEVNIKVEKKTGLTYTLVTLYKINMDNPYYTCEPGKTIDNSKQKCDKYLPFEYTPKENLELGTYKITISGKDKADNSSSETSFTLNISSLTQVITPEEEQIIEEEIKDLPQEKQEQIKEEFEITKPIEPSAFMNLFDSVIAFARDLLNSIGQGAQTAFNWTGFGLAYILQTVGSGIQLTFNTFSSAIAFIFSTSGRALAFAGQIVGQGISSVAGSTQSVLVFVGEKIGEGTRALGDGYNNFANNAPGVAQIILIGIGNGVSTTTSAIANTTNAIANTTVGIAQSTGFAIGNAANSIGSTTATIAQNTGLVIASLAQKTVKTAEDGIANTTFKVGEKVQDVSDTAGIAIMKFGSQFVTEPTEISNVIAVAISPTSVKVSWTTNHPANGKVNWGYEDGVYTFEDQTDKRTTQHEFVLTNLKPNSEYHYEVMSHNKNYVYDANRKFTTPAE